MLEALLSSGIALLSQVAPLLSTSGAITSAIKFAAAIIPPAAKLAQEGIPVIKAAIATIRGNALITKAQMDDLDALDAQCDAIFDTALEKAEAEDKAQG